MIITDQGGKFLIVLQEIFTIVWSGLSKAKVKFRIKLIERLFVKSEFTDFPDGTGNRKSRKDHSVLKLFTGFVVAALTAIYPAVSHAVFF
jgi:hypothetical protein